jgi:T5SS/PEP-CTERM-associated repeat protein
MTIDFNALSSAEKVTAVYVAYYGRAADPAGRSYWANRLEESGGDLSAIVDAFGNSEEAVARFGSVSTEAAVTSLFESLFNRQPDAAGLEFYVGELDAGRLTLQSIALDVLNGAVDNDADIVANKLSAANTYTDTVETAGATVDATDAENVIASVDETASSVEAAKQFAETAVSSEPGISLSGQVFEIDEAVTELSETAERLDIGRDGDGLVAISGGSTLTAQAGTDDGAVELGIETSGSGILKIEGDGSLLETTGPSNGVRAGMAGTGTLSVTDGGTLSTLYLGAGFKSDGVVTVSGEGSLIKLSPAGGNFADPIPDQAALLSVGHEDGSRGEVNVTDGGRLEVLADADTVEPGMMIGRDAGSVGVVNIDGGSALVSGAASETPSGPFVHVGRNGEGALTVKNGGTLETQGITSSISVGRYEGGDGTLDVLSGGRVDTLYFFAGRAGANGTAKVSGEGSVLSVTGVAEEGIDYAGDGAYAAIGRGDGGTGEMTVDDGGLLEVVSEDGINTSFHLGRDANSSGSLTISGSGSSVIVDNKNPDYENSNIMIGRGGEGSLVVENGGKIQGDYYFGIGHQTGSSGRVDVIGQGSEMALVGAIGPEADGQGDGGVLKVGRAGNGELYVREGGVVTVEGEDTYNPFMSIGDRDGGDGYVSVDGAGSKLRLISNDSPEEYGGGFVVGDATTGTLEITNGGQVTMEGNNMFFTVGELDGGMGTITIEGEGSLLNAGRSLTLGVEGGTGNVTVGAGGTLTAGEAVEDGIIDITINAGSSLQVLDGGTLEGDVQNNGGTFEPGNSPGHVTITGDFVSQGHLLLEVEGADANAFDRIDVGGTATLSGDIVIDFSAAKGLDADDEWTLIETNDGLNAENADFIVRGLDPDLEASVSVGTLGVSVDLDAA